MLKYSRNANHNQQSGPLSLQKILVMISSKTGSNPKPSNKSYLARCPAHDDKHASLSITESSNSTILLYCFAGCTIREICNSLQIKVKDLFPKSRGGVSYG